MITLNILSPSTVAVYQNGECLDCFDCLTEATSFVENFLPKQEVEIVNSTGVDPTVGETVQYTVRRGDHAMSRWVHNVRNPFALRKKIAADNAGSTVSFRRLAY